MFLFFGKTNYAKFCCMPTNYCTRYANGNEDWDSFNLQSSDINNLASLEVNRYSSHASICFNRNWKYYRSLKKVTKKKICEECVKKKLLLLSEIQYYVDDWYQTKQCIVL